MKKMKRLLALILALVMALALVACGGGEDEAEGGEETGDGSQTEITMWAFPTFGVDSGYEQELADAFMEKNPDVKVTVTTIDFTSGPEQLTAAMSSETAPDILFDAPGRIIEYANGGYLVNLDDMFTDEFKADLTNEALLDTCVAADGSYYMYPISSAPFYMGLNKEMLEKADALQYVNLEGDRTWTTDNFVKMCEALRDAGVCQTPGIVYCGAQGGDQGTRALVQNLFSSNGFVDADGKWVIDEGAQKALELLQKMYNEKSMDAGFDMAAADELQQFQKETCAMTFCWGTSNEVSYAPVDDAYTQIAVPFPSDDGVPALEYLVNGFCVFDNKDEARVDAAKRFIQFICDDAEWGPKSVVKTNAFPVRASFGDLYPGDEHKAMLASWAQFYGPYYNTQTGFATMRGQWWNLLQRVFQGGVVADEITAFNTNSNANA